MPGVLRYTIDRLLPHAELCVNLGIPALALFPAVEPTLKTADGREATNPKGLVPRAVAALKKNFPQLGVITDAALDPYTTHGHDGVLDKAGYVMNDRTVSVLQKQALVCAQAGVDIGFRHESVERFLGRASSITPMVIVDPPRTGVSSEAMRDLIRLAPPRLLYVSCDVATLARDARRLFDGGYRLRDVEAFDLFPNTPHVEAVAVFEH